LRLSHHALLKARRRNALIIEDREEIGPYFEWRRSEISQSEYMRIVWGMIE